MKKLFNKFPREIAFPKRFIIHNSIDFYHHINNGNSIKNVYSSLYECDEQGKYQHSEIDKIFFDFDSDKSYDDICLLHNKLSEENIKHLMVFSGGGFHLYIFTQNGKGLKNNKIALTNVHDYYCKMLNLDLDKHIRGDISRITRVPNTFNTKRRRYCIPISNDDIKEGFEFIREKAKKQSFKYIYYGRELLDMKQFDNGSTFNNQNTEIDIETLNQIDKDEILKKLPVFIGALLLDGNCNWRERFLIILYLRDLGYTKKEVVELLKGYLTPKKFKHCVLEERQVDYIFHRNDIIFPSVKNLEMEGYFISKEDEKILRGMYK